ncbi:MAG: TRAP transporter substrate-binding protein [Deltaproteobacteria bacterium]|nr:TRAP transporter substrate-binding protein [Deltaproteobacteria bacterium]
MFKKKLSFIVIGCFLFSLLLVGAGASPVKAVELTYSTFFPAPHIQAVLAVEWAKEVEKRTNAAVKVTVFPGGTLTPANQCYDGVVKGISDIGMSVLSYTPGRFPLMEVIDMPLGYKNGAQATRLINAFYKKFQPKELDDTKVMFLMDHGPGLVNTKKPANKLEDLKGMKIRCTGTSSKVVTHLGATPVAMPQTEAYDALQKGVVDGVMSPIETAKGWKFAEVVKYHTMNYGSAYSLGFFVVMNKQKWNALPKDLQAAMEKLNQEWIEKSARAWDQSDKEGIDHTKSKGNQIITLSKQEEERWAKLVSPILNEYVTAMKGKGLPGEEALKFCQEWLKSNQ